MPVTRLLQLVLMLALLFAPLGMVRAHAAMPAHAPAATAAAVDHDMGAAAGGHCSEAAPAGQDEPDGDGTPDKNIDCTIACSCMPAAAGELAGRAPFADGVRRPGPLPLLTGLSPQAEPRPPRRS